MVLECGIRFKNALRVVVRPYACWTLLQVFGPHQLLVYSSYTTSTRGVSHIPKGMC